MRLGARLAFLISSASVLLSSRFAAAADDPHETPDLRPESAPIKKPLAPVRLETTQTFDFYGRATSTWSKVPSRSTQGLNLNGGVTWAAIMRQPRSWLTFAFDSELAGGGGDSDLEGIIRFYGYVGAEAPGRVGPFVRAGAGFDYRGNDQYLVSVLDLPAAQLGFAVTRDDVAFRVGTFGAYAATGRFDAGEGTERVLDGAFTWGGFADVRGVAWPFLVRSELRMFGMPGSVTGAPIEWTGRGCFAIDLVMTCLDGSAMQGRVKLADEPPSVDATVGYVGVSLGVGALASR